MDKLESQIEQVKRDLAQAPVEVKPVVKKVKKLKRSAQAEKPEKRAAKGNGHKEPSDLVTVADLAEEAKMAPQSARVKLRASNIDRPEGRWAWQAGSKALKEARKILGLS